MTTVNQHRVVLAVGGAVAVNLVVLGPALVTVGSGGFDPFAILPVAIATAVGALGGIVVHAVFRRAFDGATTARLGVLGLMHIAAAGVIVAALVDWRGNR